MVHEMIVNIMILSVGFITLVKAADWLVDGAASMARKLRVTDLAIGLTVVAFGTSTPELFVNVFASIQGNTGIAIGNIVGSNIFNVLFILGISSLIRPLALSRGTVWKEIPFSLLAALVLGALANDALLDRLEYSVLTRVDGLVFMAFFGIFVYYIASIAKGSGNEEHNKKNERGLVKSLLMVGGGLVGLVLGGKLVVSGAVDLATRLKVSESLAGLTIVAAGTSLPELATSAIAAYKKNPEIAVGNILGSNIFNIFFVLGASALIKPLPIPFQGNTDMLVLVGTSLLLFSFMFTGKRRKLDRWEGAVFLLLYAVYTVFLIKRG